MARIIAAVILIVMAGVGAVVGADRSMGGIKAGPLLSFAVEDEKSSISTPSNIFGLKAGFFYTHKISDIISLQPEIQFALKGVHYYSVSSRHYKPVRFSYLEVPFLVNARVVREILELFVGPYAALLLGHTPLDDTHKWTYVNTEDLKRFDFGVCLGARFWWRDISLEIRLMRGFIDVLPADYNRGHYNTTIALQIGCNLLK